MNKIGYKKNDYTKYIRQFLIDNDVDFSHFLVGGKPTTTFTKNAFCQLCLKQFSFLYKPSRKEQVFCSKSCATSMTRRGNCNPNFIDGRYSYRDAAINQYGAKCTKCAFDNLYAIIVHHKDRNRNNNDISNLEVLCANCHYIEHKAKF